MRPPRWSTPSYVSPLPSPGNHSDTSPEAPIPEGVEPLLRNSNTIQTVVRAFREGGYAGDDLRPPLLAYIAMTSRLLERPMNLAFVAPSSAGKNRTVDAAAALMPPGALYVERAGSERALIYAGDDFAHRVVVFAEADSIPEERPAASAIRSLASDNVLAYDVVEQNPDTKQFETRHIEKPGPTGLMTTSIKSLQAQLGTRVLEVPIKDSSDLTRAVVLSPGGDSSRRGIRWPGCVAVHRGPAVAGAVRRTASRGALCAGPRTDGSR